MTVSTASTLDEVRTAIVALTRRLEEVRDLPQEGIADLKDAVDDIRMRLWGILMASDTSDYQSFVARFRMRRAAECLRGLVGDVSVGRIPRDSIEATMLHSAASQIATYLDPTSITTRLPSEG